MSKFIQIVIDCLNKDDFLRNYTEPYINTETIMDRDAGRRSCAIKGGWNISVYHMFPFTIVGLYRDNIEVPITWKERRALVKAFKGAIKRLKADREKYLKSLRD